MEMEAEKKRQAYHVTALLLSLLPRPLCIVAFVRSSGEECQGLAHVCRHFRAVALSEPALWSDIDVFSPQRVPWLLQHADSHLLNIHIELSHAEMCHINGQALGSALVAPRHCEGSILEKWAYMLEHHLHQMGTIKVALPRIASAILGTVPSRMMASNEGGRSGRNADDHTESIHTSTKARERFVFLQFSECPIGIRARAPPARPGGRARRRRARGSCSAVPAAPPPRSGTACTRARPSSCGDTWRAACVDSGSNSRSVVRVKEISITGDEDGRGRALRRTKADNAGLYGHQCAKQQTTVDGRTRRRSRRWRARGVRRRTARSGCRAG
jgi:hypothetical protein